MEAAVEAGLAAVKAGASILDIGGESTRPGAERVHSEEQIRRVCPVVSALREHTDVALSVDTTRAEVADAALHAGVNAINDVSAGSEDPEMFGLAADKGCGLVLMHRGAPPPEDQWSDAWSTPPAFEDVVVEVRAALEGRAEAAEAAGVSPDAIVLDPGLGFGKDVDQNWILAALLRTEHRWARWLVGASRKSFIRAVTGVREPRERVPGSLVAAVLAMQGGAEILRVHDVAAHVQTVHAFVAQGMPDSKLGSRIRPTPTSFSPPKITETTMSELQSIGSNFDSLTASGVVLIDFWAEWCAPCKMLMPTIEQVASETAGKATVGKINIDDSQELALKFKFHPSQRASSRWRRGSAAGPVFVRLMSTSTPSWPALSMRICILLCLFVDRKPQGG